MNYYVGTSGYSYKEWKGSFYPAKLPAKQMLRFYGEHFRAVEINYTFKRTLTASVLKSWASAVPADFQFVLKAPQQITHWKRLQDAGDSIANFLDIGAKFKKHLGPLLFQLPPDFQKDAPRLRAFLELLPVERRVTLEFRHPSWFDDEIFGLLREQGAALCIAEDEHLEAPFVATTDWGYLRLRQLDYDDPALQTRVKQVRKQKWRDVFVFFKHEDEGKGPKLAKRFLELAKS
jgi:uncharacterized protein YecE (DUF72 family)